MRYKCWRSTKDKEVHLICAEGSEAFEALPAAIRSLGPWTGSREGEITHITKFDGRHYWAEGEVYFRPISNTTLLNDAKQLGMRAADHQGVYFETSRAKTGRKALATISKDTELLLERYLAGLAFVLPPDQPFIRNRSQHVYTKDTLGDDFRDVRQVVFPGDTRRLMDMRRTGNVEAIAGGAQPPELAAKLSNTIGKSNEIFDTYSPVHLETVRKVDKAREIGRRELLAAAVAREQDGNKSGKFPTPAPVSESELGSNPAPTKKANG